MKFNILLFFLQFCFLHMSITYFFYYLTYKSKQIQDFDLYFNNFTELEYIFLLSRYLMSKNLLPFKWVFSIIAVKCGFFKITYTISVMKFGLSNDQHEKWWKIGKKVSPYNLMLGKNQFLNLLHLIPYFLLVAFLHMYSKTIDYIDTMSLRDY